MVDGVSVLREALFQLRSRARLAQDVGAGGVVGLPQRGLGGKAERGEGLYAVDRVSSIKRSEENSLVQSLYGDVLKGRVHELLHVDYVKDGGHKA